LRDVHSIRFNGSLHSSPLQNLINYIHLLPSSPLRREGRGNEERGKRVGGEEKRSIPVHKSGRVLIVDVLVCAQAISVVPPDLPVGFIAVKFPGYVKANLAS
jgi:hypothetical protein